MSNYTSTDGLEIFLVTYNRSNDLNNTLGQLFKEDSPVKNCSITVLDNNSTDNTEDVVKNFQIDNPTLKYIKNNRNIGANANIAKAFEMAQRNYVWVIADDDEYHWDSWSEVQEQMEKGTDAIVVSTYVFPQMDVTTLGVIGTFVPGTIWKTSLFDSDVMGNMEYQISNMFPHFAPFAKVLNENKNIYFVKKGIVVQLCHNHDPKSDQFVRGFKASNLHPIMQSISWAAAYANSLLMIKDKKIRYRMGNTIISPLYHYPLNSFKIFTEDTIFAPHTFYDYMCVFNYLGIFDKIKFLFYAFWYFSGLRFLFNGVTDKYIFIDQDEKFKYYVKHTFRILGIKLSCKRIKNIPKSFQENWDKHAKV